MEIAGTRRENENREEGWREREGREEEDEEEGGGRGGSLIYRKEANVGGGRGGTREREWSMDSKRNLEIEET